MALPKVHKREKRGPEARALEVERRRNCAVGRRPIRAQLFHVSLASLKRLIWILRRHEECLAHPSLWAARTARLPLGRSLKVRSGAQGGLSALVVPPVTASFQASCVSTAAPHIVISAALGAWSAGIKMGLPDRVTPRPGWLQRLRRRRLRHLPTHPPSVHPLLTLLQPSHPAGWVAP